MQDTFGIGVGDNLAGGEGASKVLQEWALLDAITVSKEGDNGVGRFLGVVERNLREQVVNDVVINDLVEEMASNETKSSVNSAQGTLDEGPGILIVMRNIRVSVVQVCDGNYMGG